MGSPSGVITMTAPQVPCQADTELRTATIEDHDSILSLTRNEDLYSGLDYLPSILQDWLRESGSSERSMRENYVLTKGDVVVGFVSVYFQNDRNTAVKFAFRIGKEWRGDGYGRMTTSLLNRRLTHTYPQLGSIISAIPDVDLTEDQMRSHKFGNLLTVKAISVYKFRCDQLTLKEPQARLDTLSKIEFAEALRECRLQHLLENNILHLNWVPVRAQTDQD